MRSLGITPRRILWIVLAWTAGLIGTSSAAERPNFVFILSDDHRWDALGAAGNPKIITPNLDRLAAQGVYFRQATVLVPQCSPCRAVLLTALPPHQNGWFSNQVQRRDVRRNGIDAKLPTLPGLLQAAGYRTVLVGKWHVRPAPWQRGFSDVRVWLPGGGAAYRNPKLKRGPSRQDVPFQGYTTEIFANAAIEFLESPAALEKPFFLWLATTAPHAPFGPNPDRIRQLYAARGRQNLRPPTFGSGKPKNNWRNYYEAVSHLDEQVGRVLATLEKRGLAEKTVVVFMGDNGLMMGSRGLGGKVVPYDESVRVPMMVRAPMLKGFRGRSDAPVSSADLPPTFLALAGVAAPKEWAGRDLTPLLRGERAQNFGEAVCEWADDRSEKFGSAAYRLIRTQTHKLILWKKEDRTDELYDIAADPSEQNNLFNDLSARLIREDLLRRLKAWMEKTGDPALQWKKVTARATRRL